MTSVLLFCGLASFAQKDSVANALTHHQKGQLSLAKIAIESACKNSETANDAATWYYKGFIFKDIYKLHQNKANDSILRMESLQAFKKSIALDATREYIKENRNNIKYLASSFLNDASAALEKQNYNSAITNYKYFKENIVIADSAINLTQKDIEFKLALASLCNRIYESIPDTSKNKEFFKKTITLYNEILKVDPNNLSANYNLGLMYYNKAVNIIKVIDYDTDLIKLADIRDVCVTLFKQALPFMEKAHQLILGMKETRIKKRDILVGLSGIYFSLNDIEKSNGFKQEITQIDQEQKK